MTDRTDLKEAIAAAMPWWLFPRWRNWLAHRVLGEFADRRLLVVCRDLYDRLRREAPRE